MESKKNLAIYIHWPFCKKKCPYCDFNSHVKDQVDHMTWANNLSNELKFYAEKLQNRAITSVFFGGGTPSLMMPETVKRCLNTIHDHWEVLDGCEITLEANPTSSESDKFKAFKQAGINRLSIGVQSLNDNALSFLGREHSANEAVDAIKMAREIYQRVSFDLIYGRPEQSLNDWKNELKDALKLNPDHISVYQLTIEQGTAFHTMAGRGDFIMPNDDLQADFYDVTQKTLNDAGLPAYEISNHSKSGQESRHNLSYWHYDDYIGIGPGAHGRFMDESNIRYASRAHKAPDIWMDMVSKNGHGAHPYEKISKDQAFEEMMMMGLRLTKGVSLQDIQDKTGINAINKIDPRKIDQLQKENYLIVDSGTITCTPNGLKTLNSLLAYLLS